jgi:X-X-X-Leu-X-X-Gly heptad repeat protein
MRRTSGTTKQISYVLLILLVLSVTFGSQSFAGGLNTEPDESKATPKHETIFAKLDYHGSVSDIYAVNTFLEPAAEIVDYGSYVNLVNLTNKAEPRVEGERIIFSVIEEDTIFRYQGTLQAKELPWEFEISYFLDGKSIDPKDLPGAAGRLRIELAARKNPRYEGVFAENFMVQLSVSLEMDKATAIVAPAAVKTYVGNIVTLAFTLLPDSDALFYMEADVRDFQMDGISIAALEAAVPSDDMVADLESGFDEMAAGMEELVDGTKKLQEGMIDLNEGVEKLYGGVDGIDGGGAALLRGMDEYAAGFSVLTEGLDALGSGAAGFNNALSGMAAALPQLSGGYAQAEGGVDALLANKEQMEQLAMTLAHNPDPQVRMLAEAMLGQLAGLGQLQSGIEKANEGLAAHSGALSEVAAQFAEFERGFQKSLDGAEKLENGFSGIRTATGSLFDGVSGIKDGAAELKQNTAALPEAAQKLIDGQKELKDGVMRAKNEIAHFDAGGEQNETVSFVAPGKADAKSVQFVFRTPPIEPGETPVAETYDEEHKSIWQRFLDLFRQLAHNLNIMWA